MDLHLAGTVALVTGAAKGIGLAVTGAWPRKARSSTCRLRTGHLIEGGLIKTT